MSYTKAEYSGRKIDPAIAAGAMNPPPAANEERIPVDGFEQVLEMLKIADPAFRASLLKRLAARDPQLARSLHEDLLSMGL